MYLGQLAPGALPWYRRSHSALLQPSVLSAAPRKRRPCPLVTSRPSSRTSRRANGAAAGQFAGPFRPCRAGAVRRESRPDRWPHHVNRLLPAIAVSSPNPTGRTEAGPEYWYRKSLAEIDPRGCAVSREGGTMGLNVECPLVHGDICRASRNVAATYVRTWQHAQAAAIRRTAIQDLGCAPELLN